MAASRSRKNVAVPRDGHLPGDPAALRRALLAWWDRGRRDLPWRRTRDPWAILVSEVMLQQTTVAAVRPYWERFLARWPTPADLARAGDDELLAAWAGLGYYSRARNLRATAIAVCEAGGGLPPRSEQLLALPGIGPYTAAAVASIAWDEPVAAVDGNVERVLSRLLALEADPRRAAGRLALRGAAAELLDRRRPGDFNQALMELGATVCRPSAPACGDCPLRTACVAHARGEPTRFPLKAGRPATLPVVLACALVERGGRVLLRRRAAPPNAGFLELPGCELARGEGAAAAAAPVAEDAARRALAAALATGHGLLAEPGEALPRARHAIMHTSILLLPFRTNLRRGAISPPLQWAEGSAGSTLPADLPLTTLARRVLAGTAREAPRPTTPPSRSTRTR